MKPRLELIVRRSEMYEEGVDKLTLKRRDDEYASIRNAIRDAGFKEGDKVVLVREEDIPA